MWCWTMCLPAARRWSAATPTATTSSRPPRPGSTSADYTVTQADLNAGADLVNVAGVDTDQTDAAERRRHLHGGPEPGADDREVADERRRRGGGHGGRDDRVHDHGGQHRQRRPDQCGAGRCVCRRRDAGQRRRQRQQHPRDHRDLGLHGGLHGHAGRPERRRRPGERGGGRHRPDRRGRPTTPPPRWTRTRR